MSEEDMELALAPRSLTLTAFLLARIAEDEVVANAALPCDDDSDDSAWGEFGEFTNRRGNEAVALAFRYGPARVLAECEAKRQIVELHHEYLGVCTYCVDVHGEYQREVWPCPTLRILATTYSDHPDFREEWRP